MAMEHGGHSVVRITLANVVRLVPAVLILAVTLSAASCNGSGGGLFGEASSTPTSTVTPGNGGLAWVTTFASGNVSSFTRNTTTGVLKRTGTVAAGAKNGPTSVVAAPSNSFVYVVNNSDRMIYEYAVNGNNGTLSALFPASVDNGSGSGPHQAVLNPAGTFMWVTGAGNGTVTTYSVDTSTGQLTKQSTLIGLSSPLGLAVDSTGTFLYVADNGAGLIYSFSINASTGALTQQGLAVNSLGTSAGNPAFIAIDPGGAFLYVDDLVAGVISVLSITSGNLAFGAVVPSTTSANAPFGIGIAQIASVGNYILTANQGGDSIWAFLIQSLPFVAPPVAFGSPSAPTGLVVDPQNHFVYTANNGDGTVSEFALNVPCPINIATVCPVNTVFAQQGNSSTSGPYAMTLSH